MDLQRLSLDRYKGYAKATVMELAPLTILVGANNSGKTALAQAIPLLAGGLIAPTTKSSEPLPLESAGVRHGERFEDLVTGRPVHGRLTLSATLAREAKRLSLTATVRNVVTPGQPSERQVSRWELKSAAEELLLERKAFDQRSLYDVAVSGRRVQPRSVVWRGLAPSSPNPLPSWITASIDSLGSWAEGVRHLQCPRRLLEPPYNMPERLPWKIGPRGEHAPLVFAANDSLRAAVREWYRAAFGVRLERVVDGNYFRLEVRQPGAAAGVALGQSGRGLAHVLPVVVTALTARAAGPGVDIIEHPEAELHPAAHAEIAELLLDQLAGPTRPLILETHSEIVLLRARRWVAEGRLPAEHVLVYWVHSEPDSGSSLRRIRIGDNGEVDNWPDNVFIEDYEEILAIRRAARRNG